MMNKKIFSLAVLPMFLIGCKTEYTYSYLMQHPRVVKDEVIRCQSIAEKTPQCAVVMQAAMGLSRILDEQQQSPELFGQKILDTEFAYVEAKQKWLAAKKHVAQLKEQNHSAEEMAAAQKQVDELEKIYQDKRDEMKVLLAVAGLSSPE